MTELKPVVVVDYATDHSDVEDDESQQLDVVQYVPSKLSVIADGAWMVCRRQFQLVQRDEWIRSLLDRPGERLLSLMLAGATMGSLHYSYVFICMPALDVRVLSAPCIFFHACWTLAWCSGLKGVATDPGAIPAEWHRDLLSRMDSQPDARRLHRYCTKEKKFKPERAHYCSKLARNVLRMDHYCHFAQTPIGYHNHKLFVLGMFYMMMVSNFTEANLIYALTHGSVSAGASHLMVYSGLVVSSVYSLVLTPYFAFHCWLMGKNFTTLEYWQNCRDSVFCNSPYDKGVLRNIHSIMGEEWYFWWLPVGKPVGSGTEFETIEAQAVSIQLLDGSWVRRSDGAAVGDISYGLLVWDHLYDQPPSKLSICTDGTVKLTLGPAKPHWGRFRDGAVPRICWNGGEVWICNVRTEVQLDGQGAVGERSKGRQPSMRCRKPRICAIGSELLDDVLSLKSLIVGSGNRACRVQRHSGIRCDSSASSESDSQRIAYNFIWGSAS